MRKKIFVLTALIAMSAVFFLDSCRKDLVFDNTAVIEFQADSVHFDTAFTSTTTATRKLLLYNTSDKSVNINRLYLENGENSYFRMGIDGQTGYDLRDIVILPNDSSYVFISATISSNSDSIPFLVMDKLVAETDGGSSSCLIDAYGQNAVFYTDSIISVNTSWTKDLPIVLIGDVLVNEGVVLNIEAGARIYTQSKKFLYILGTLNATGTETDSILFQGNRLDRDYFLDADHAGEWGGIYLGKPSHDNFLEHVYIKNASVGIYVDSIPTQGHYKLRMRKSTVFNCLGQGIYSFESSIDLQNCRLISNNVNLAMVKGGELYMNHCTLGGYSVPFNPHSSTNQSVSMVLLNYFIDQNVLFPGSLTAKIYNSAITGSLANEATIDSVSSAGFDLELRNVLMQTETPQSQLQVMASVYDNVILNVAPGFTEPSERDYDYNSTSPLYRATSTFTLPQDIHDNARSVPTDIGCEEIF